MATSNLAIYAQSGLLGCVQVGGATNTALDGTGTLSSAVTMSSNGSIVDMIWFKAIVATTASMIRIFFAADGSTYRLIGEVLKEAITPDDDTKSWEAQWSPPPGVANCPASSTWKFASVAAELVNCHVMGENL